MSDTRKKKRYPANWVMIRLPESKPRMGKLCDISETGLQFLGNAKLKKGEKLPGVISLKYLVENPFKVEDFAFDMKILWEKPNQGSSFKFAYGAEFDLSKGGLDDKSKADVIRFLEAKLAESH